MTAPLVNVVIPTFNGGRYIGAALAGLLAQGWQDWSCLVLDDCSTDDTLSRAVAFGDPRLRALSNPRRMGLAGNWNQGIECSQGNYVLILHQDDILAPEMLERQVAALEANPNAGYAYSAYRLIDAQDNTLQLVMPFPRSHVWPGAREFERHIRQNYVQCPTVLVRRACYETVGLFDPRLEHALDWEMWLRIEAHGYEICYTAEPLAGWRLHASSATRMQASRPDLIIQDELAALDLSFEKLTASAAPLRALRRQAFYARFEQCLLRAYDAARHGGPAGARPHLRAARLVLTRGGDWGLLPFLAQDALDYLGRKARRARSA